MADTRIVKMVLGACEVWHGFLVFTSLAIFGIVFASPTANAQTRRDIEVGVTVISSGIGIQRAVRSQQLVARARAEGRLRVIVGLRVAFSNPDRLSPVDRNREVDTRRFTQATVLERIGAGPETSVHSFEFVPFFAVDADATILENLLRDPLVRSVQENIAVPPALMDCTPPTPGSLCGSRRIINSHYVANAGYTGVGQTVAILDTGVDKTHPMLRCMNPAQTPCRSKIVQEGCYSSGRINMGVVVARSLCPQRFPSPSEAVGSGVNCRVGLTSCWHGTHVASIAAGNSLTRDGIASSAGIISIQVFSEYVRAQDCRLADGRQGPTPCIKAQLEDIISGLEQVIRARNSFNLSAVNLSFGGGVYSGGCSDVSPVFNNTVYNMSTVRILTVAASGNSQSLDGVSWPACDPLVLAVGSTDKHDVVAAYSNHTPQVDLLAPGGDDVSTPGLPKTEGIIAAVPVAVWATPLLRQMCNFTGVPTDMCSMSGTSQAAPHVTGSIAQLRQQMPFATPEEIWNALRCTGRPLVMNGVRVPRLNVLAASTFLMDPPVGVKTWSFRSLSDFDYWVSSYDGMLLTNDVWSYDPRGFLSLDAFIPPAFNFGNTHTIQLVNANCGNSENEVIEAKFSFNPTGAQNWQPPYPQQHPLTCTSAGILYKAELDRPFPYFIEGYPGTVVRSGYIAQIDWWPRQEGDRCGVYSAVVGEYQLSVIRLNPNNPVDYQTRCTRKLGASTVTPFYSHVLRVEVSSGAHRIYLDGTLYCSFVDRTHPTGKFGLIARSQKDIANLAADPFLPGWLRVNYLKVERR